MSRLFLACSLLLAELLRGLLMILETIFPKRLNYLFFFFLSLVFLAPIRISFALPAYLQDKAIISKKTTQSTGIKESAKKCGIGIELDGINDWVNIPNFTLANDFTVEGWVKLAPGLENNDALFGQEGSGSDINFYEGKARLYADEDRVTAKTALIPETWSHVAITRSGTNLMLYINGVQDATGSWNGTLSLKAIGRGNRGFLKGMLDEIRVWNIARTKADISASFDIGVNPNTPGLIGYWHFNEAKQVVIDSSRLINHGSLGANTKIGTDDPVRLNSTAPFSESCDKEIGRNYKIEPVANFVVLQSLLFDANKPSNEEFLSRYKIDYLPELGHGFKAHWDIAGGDDPFYDPPNEEFVKRWAIDTIENFGFIDIEHLPVKFDDDWDDDWNGKTAPVKITDADRERSIRKMASIVDWAHEANPKLKIGYYGVLPQREYWAFVQPARMNARLNKLKQRNQQFKALADHVDVLFPSLYTFYNKPDEWKIYARGMVEETRIYNKPAYVFIWPIYHASNPTLGGQFISGDFWRIQLEEIYKLGYDGIVIWGGYKKQWKVSASDTDPGNWWYQTLAFMRSKGLLPADSTWKP